MRTRWLPVVLLLVLAPVSAEYLSAYDESTGHPLQLLSGLLFLGPLYGAPALLIRESARRWGLGWGGIVLLAAAFGVVEAGIVDQSIFSSNYRAIPYWPDIADPTWVPQLGLGGYLVASFVGGHVVNSIAAPIALTEALAGPDRGRDPWLGRPTIIALVVLYAAASALIAWDHQTSETDHASVAQMLGAAVVAMLLVLAALRCRPRPVVSGRPAAPSPGLAFVAAFAVALGAWALPPTPLGLAGLLTAYAVAAAGIGRLARRPGWSATHLAALAGGAVTAFAALAFWAEPLGAVSPGQALAHHVVALTATLVVTLVAVRRAARRSLDRVARPA